MIGFNYSQLKINYLNNTPSTSRRQDLCGVFNKDIKVPLQEAELVGTSSSNIATPHTESNGLDELRKLGHRPGGYGNAVEDYWPRPGRSLMQAHPGLSWLSNIKALKLVKAVAGLEKWIFSHPKL